jgi:ketosteroid isomerase-like protein
MQGPASQDVVKAYLQAYEERDLSRCMDFYTEDPTIQFGMAVYRGREAAERWHQDRFAANFRIIRIEEVRSQGNTVIVDAVATSNRVKIWRLDSLGGRATFVLYGGKINEAKYGLRTGIQAEGWR